MPVTFQPNLLKRTCTYIMATSHQATRTTIHFPEGGRSLGAPPVFSLVVVTHYSVALVCSVQFTYIIYSNLAV